LNKNVGIFCRLNAARSPILEALLAKHNPNYVFFSSGVDGREGMELPEITKEYAKILGLTNLKEFSSNVRNQEEGIIKADLLLGVDDFICNRLKILFPDGEFFSLESHSRDLGIELEDPVDKVGYEFQYILGRLLYFGLSAFRQLECQNNFFPITALIARKKNLVDELKIFLDSHSVGTEQPLIVDCNFKFATEGEYLELFPINKQHESVARSIIHLTEGDLSSISLIRSAYEVNSWELFVASLEWRRWLVNISKTRPILLLCTPVDIIEGEKHNSFLEALNADRLIYRL
jgi:protein-tyrosine-phosphatase